MATPPPKGPCRLFGSKGGCDYGKKCNFSHDLGSASGTRATPQSHQWNVQSSLSPAAPGTRSGRSGNVAPRNLCDFYWNTGQCNRGFDCTFKHQRNNNPQPGITPTNTAVGVENEEDAANVALEFFTMESLTQMAGVGFHSAQEGTPENAHNLIMRYLRGGSLNSPAEMKPLAAILASVNRRNYSWVCVFPLSTSLGFLLTLQQTVGKAQVIPNHDLLITSLTDYLRNSWT